MVSSLQHRGPDETGELLSHDVQMAVVRLSIIDLKEGHQPVGGCDDALACVYNGEVYNYLNLRRELRERGHRLVNQCDSIVLPHLYEELGDALVSRLRGMFALALWDRSRRRLLLARDRLGIKPLYIAETTDYLLFASEVKALLASGLVPREIDRDSLDDLFSLSYPCPPRTMFRGIREIRPAHYAVARAGVGLETPQRYWSPPFAPRGEHRRVRRRDAEAELRDALRRKVYDHLQADVRVATYLSGGLDSSAISALVKEVTGDPPTTFTIGFSAAEHDERDFAGTMVDHLGAENHTVVCDQSVADLYPQTLWHTELPLQFPLALPLQLLSARARAEGFRVVLTGEGADEILGGYDCFRADKMRRLTGNRILRSIRPHLYRKLYGWLKLPVGTVELMLANQARESEIARRFGGVYPPWYDVWTMLDVDRGLLLSPDGRSVRPPDEPPDGFTDLVREDVADLHPFDAVLSLELETRLPAWILLIGDRASMAESMEARVPLLDHEILELVAPLPPSFKMRGFTEKALLRSAVSELLPDRVRNRQKRPFYTPLKQWFFSDGAPDYVDELLSERALRDAGLFAPEVVKKLRQDLQRIPEHLLLKVQTEWVLTLVLGTQLLHHLFVADFVPGRSRPEGVSLAGAP